MRKIFLLIVLFIFGVFNANADSDYLNDYTLIDCINGDNDSGIAFDSSKPYATLKQGIEKTIDYINLNVNKTGNETTASGLIFNVKIECSFDDIFNKSINLNFLGVDYNNELILEGINENSFLIKDTDFKLGYKAGNITFKNAKFLNENKAYFSETFLSRDDINRTQPFVKGIKIVNSYIKLVNGNNIGAIESYQIYYERRGSVNRGLRTEYFNYINYENKQCIENSIIDIEVNNNFNFKLPFKIKNSKINFTNGNGEGPFNINFLEEGNSNIYPEYNFSTLVSNEIDLGGNNFLTENTTAIAFFNNKFTNFNNFDFSGDAIYINNYIENNEIIDISNSHNLYNNVLKSGFTDTYDIMNNRRNFAENNINNKGLGWVFKRVRNLDFFNVEINSADLYKEVTGKDFPKGLGDIYIVFNY